ncbi:hypothetical protein [Chryseobacterium sp.]|uniref:hypothetical protein n=1 Tax=Chryseobacterium sp. TaxID=1871047 RepID=UPI0031D548B6
MDTLFVNGLDEIIGPQEYNHDSYTYYSGSSRQEIIDAKVKMEEWFSMYPHTEKNDLRNNFKNDFQAGFFELFLYTLFTKMGYKIIIHPDVPGSTKKPDFLVCGFGTEFYLEAKVSFHESANERLQEKMLGSLYKVLDEAAVPNFCIYLRTIRIKSGKQPKSNIIRAAVENTINSYNVDELWESMNNGKVSQPPVHIFEDDDVFIEYGPIPLTIEGRGREGRRAIGIYGGDAKILHNVESLRSAFKVKAGRYGPLDKPYMIAVNAIDMLALNKDDMMDCLMGTTCIIPDFIRENEPVQQFRGHDGFFTGIEDRGQNTRVSAAFVTKVNPGSWKDAEYWIFENEKASSPIDLRKSELITRFIENNIIYRTNGKSFGEIIE